MYHYLSSTRLRHIIIHADYRHYTQTQVEKMIQPLSGENIFHLKIGLLIEQLKKLPWVKTVTINRKGLRTLVVTLQDYTAIATWNKQQLIGQHGQLFTVAKKSWPVGLPAFSSEVGKVSAVKGHDQSRVVSKLQSVLDYYKRLQPLLLSSHLQLLSLTDVEEIGWQMKVRAARHVMTVILGDSESHSQNGACQNNCCLQRFLQVYPELSSHHLGWASRVDLRYANGFTVNWSYAVPKLRDNTGS